MLTLDDASCGTSNTCKHHRFDAVRLMRHVVSLQAAPFNRPFRSTSNHRGVIAECHACLDQYRANKVNGGNGGLKWIAKGGGYYSECNKRLKGAA